MVFVMFHEPLFQVLYNGLIVLYWSNIPARPSSKKTPKPIWLTWQGEPRGWLEWQWASKTTTLVGSHPCISAQHQIVQYHPTQGRILMEVGPYGSGEGHVTPVRSPTRRPAPSHIGVVGMWEICLCCCAVEKRRFAFTPFDKKIILSSPNTPCWYFTVFIVLQNGPLCSCKTPAPCKWQMWGGYRAIKASRDLCSLAKKFN